MLVKKLMLQNCNVFIITEMHSAILEKAAIFTKIKLSRDVKIVPTWNTI